jgi:4'-phosphopantetheinyl transferase
VFEPVKWTCVPACPGLQFNEIHVWLSNLSVSASALSLLRGCLTAEEKERAARFHLDRDRNRFVAARGTLRNILAQYLGQAPLQLQIYYGAEGKPALALDSTGRSLSFNLSHSEDIAVLALGWDRNIGIDVERIRTDIEYEDIARSHFSTDELMSLRALPPQDRVEGFFLAWTRKEAYLKARGNGLQVPLDSFDVNLKPGEPARFVRGVDPQWQIVGWLAEPGYPAALVYDGTPSHVRFFTLTRNSTSEAD